MKKITTLLSLFLISFAFLGCSTESNAHSQNDRETSEILTLHDCAIGYKIPSYPTCKFKYKINDDLSVNIHEVVIVLKEKNFIHDNDTLSEPFYPFTLSITINGTIEGEKPKTKIKAVFISESSFSFTADIAPLESNGAFSTTTEVGTYTPYIGTVYISNIYN